jgi:hypothetical protein
MESGFLLDFALYLGANKWFQLNDLVFRTPQGAKAFLDTIIGAPTPELPPDDY